MSLAARGQRLDVVAAEAFLRLSSGPLSFLVRGPHDAILWVATSELRCHAADGRIFPWALLGTGANIGRPFLRKDLEWLRTRGVEGFLTAISAQGQTLRLGLTYKEAATLYVLREVQG